MEQRKPLLDTFGALFGAQIMHNICRFEAREVSNPALQLVCDLELEQLEDNHTKLKANFAGCEISLWL